MKYVVKALSNIKHFKKLVFWDIPLPGYSILEHSFPRQM